MGRYRAERIIVKMCTDGVLVFFDSSSIYLFSPHFTGPFVFNKWFAPLGSYRESWKPFKDALLNRRKLESANVWKLANRYGVVYQDAVGKLDLRKRKVEIKFDHWSVKGVLDDVL